jgi:hypothetical protein
MTEILSNFPPTGCCDTMSSLLEAYLCKTRKLISNDIPLSKATGIAWTENRYWHIMSIKRTSKPMFLLPHLSKLIESDNAMGNVTMNPAIYLASNQNEMTTPSLQELTLSLSSDKYKFITSNCVTDESILMPTIIQYIS